jgi:murein DD-endopeptidase MepM/ murein hydrolase activator NlpD
MHLPVKHGFSLHIRGNSPNNMFGMVRKDKSGKPKAHQGWDIAAFPGSPVYAIKNGIVRYTKDDGDVGLGKYICLEFDHDGKTLFAIYAHLQSIEVVAQQFVAEGEQIGRAGQTGNANGQHYTEAHLHFEVRSTPHAGLGLGNRIDPLTIFGYSAISEVISP